MDINVIAPNSPLPTSFAHSISITIKSFKGRRNVEVHLFRPEWSTKEEKDQDWTTLLGAPVDPSRTDPSGSKRIIMESFTDNERDRIINYLKEQYSTRLTAIHSSPLTFPVPTGLSGLSQIEAGKDVGFIEFKRIPSYPLDIPLKGLYDLAQHSPIVEE
ncbi:MAG: hypothetical protein JEY79_18940 [Pseudodesulfovibrio sp.]|nr:hypothetical protein [Pseudodesulfovibrio sp.]